MKIMHVKKLFCIVFLIFCGLTVSADNNISIINTFAGLLGKPENIVSDYINSTFNTMSPYIFEQDGDKIAVTYKLTFYDEECTLEQEYYPELFYNRFIFSNPDNSDRLYKRLLIDLNSLFNEAVIYENGSLISYYWETGQTFQIHAYVMLDIEFNSAGTAAKISLIISYGA